MSSIKMKKSDLFIAYSVIVIGISSLFGGIMSCQMGMEESFPLPPELPYASIESNNNAGDGFTAYTFALEWKRSSGIVYPGAVYNTEEEVTAALEQVMETWKEYSWLIEPRPFYDTDGDGIGLDNSFKVFIPGTTPPKLDNDPDNGNIVIHRYWPKITDASTGGVRTPTRGEWLGTATDRAVAFKKAAVEIEAMMADIEASPFFTNPPLLALYTEMAKFISHNPPLEECVQLTSFYVPGSGGGKEEASYSPGVSGPLYEYYLGHVPPPGEYSNLGSDSQFAFPE